MKKSTEEIKREFENCKWEEIDALFDSYATDTRKSVQQIIIRYQKKKQAYIDELVRMERMKQYENEYGECTFICGVDEAGRGPLAGPVVAGAVILPKACNLLYINDSKQLSEAKREALYDQILDCAIAAEVGIIGPDVIDEINILQATYLAMRTAIQRLSVKPEILLNDAVTIPDMDIKQVPIIKGDAKSISIASASILAKVTRDRMMKEYDKIFPEYGFAGHKGYGCSSHIEAIKKHGPCAIHRKTFLKNILS